MSSKKATWKNSVQKARRVSQGSSTHSTRKSSIIAEETTANELEEYLETLKKKSGIKSLWRGDSFDRVVRDKEDKTPDISISSIEDEELGERLPSEKADVGNDDDDDDFKVNLQMFSRSPSPTNGDSTESSVNPMKGLQMAELAFNEKELSDIALANNKLDDKLKSLTVSDKDIRSVINDLSEPAEVLTEDEVEEEIEEDVAEEGVVANNKNTTNTHRSLANDNKSPPRSVSDSENHTSKHEKSPTKSQHSYTTDFSSGSEIKTHSDRSHSQTYSDHKSSNSSRTSRSSRSSRSSQSSRSSKSSRSSQSSRSTKRSKSPDRSRSRRSYSDKSRSKNTDSSNRYRCDVGVQTAPPAEQFTLPPGLGVGMATSGPRLGMQYVDPSPIATHIVSPEAMEAMTAYNPAIVALNNMLREQIRLVEQFVEINQRMYESYSTGVNSSYRYTTLEDTQQFIRRNRPKTISYEEALEQVKQEER